ncbi:MAG: micrococcal nuclease [Candidatus Nanohaloarchaea archaeon]|jgi:micrococcal nuclease
MNKEIQLALILIVVASGCISVQIGDSTSKEPQFENREVLVTDVVDGDTVDFQYLGREDTVRLEGVDTPEVHTDNSPSEYEGIPETEESRKCLEKWGENASQYVKDEIGGENITLRYNLEEGEPERGYYGRIIGELLHENISINRQLVVQGYARSYSEDGPFTAEEGKARENSVGLWECRNPS